jgi:hypothetical protein
MREKTERARLSASARWDKANAMQPHSNRNANGIRNDAIKVKESKGKEKGKFSDENNPGQFTGLPDGMVL